MLEDPPTPEDAHSVQRKLVKNSSLRIPDIHGGVGAESGLTRLMNEYTLNDVS